MVTTSTTVLRRDGFLFLDRLFARSFSYLGIANHFLPFVFGLIVALFQANASLSIQRKAGGDADDSVKFLGEKRNNPATYYLDS